MKILHIYKNYYPVLGGIENHIKLVCEELAKLPDYRAQVVVTNGNFNSTREVLNGVEIIKCGRLFEWASTPVSLSMFKNLKNLSPDVVHFHFPYPPGEVLGWLSYRNSSTKFVLTYHSDVVRQAGIMKLYRPLFEQFIKRTDYVIATSPNYIQASEILNKIPDRKMRIVPFGIELDRLKNPCPKEIESHRSKYGTRIVTFVGKLRYYKGLAYLIRASRTVEAKFFIIGDGPLCQDLESLVKNLGLKDKVFFLGEIDNRSLINYLYASDVFVLPSIYRSEAFGISMLEAMACGLPVVSTELGTGTSFVNLHEKTGLVIKPADSQALAEALNLLLDNHSLRKKLGHNAQHRVREYFTHEVMLEKIKGIYHS